MSLDRIRYALSGRSKRVGRVLDDPSTRLTLVDETPVGDELVIDPSDGTVIGIVPAPSQLTPAQVEDLKRRFFAAQANPPVWSPLTDAEAAGRWQPSHDDDPAPIQAPAQRIEDAMAVFEEGVVQRYRDGVTADLHAIDDRRSMEDKYLAVCQQLREVTADRDRLEHVNDGLRTALAELGRRLDAAGPLRVADDGLLIGPYGTEAGR